MQKPTIDMCSVYERKFLDIQWTVKQWKLMDVSNQNHKRSDDFVLHGKDCYLLLEKSESDKNKKILKVILSDYLEHGNAVVRSFVFDHIGNKHELQNNEKGVRISPAKHYYYYRHSFVVDVKTVTESTDDIVFYIELMYVLERNENSCNISCYNVAEILHKAMLDDYNRMNENEESLREDTVTFLTNNVTIRAHSTMLAAASPYFSAMFRHENFKENQERSVDLSDDTDITPEIFRSFLDLVYGCQNIQNISVKLVTGICILADKYNVKELSESCGLILSRTLTIANAVELLLFADKYNCEILKKKALDYVKSNISTVKTSPNFDDLYKNKALLMQCL